ncbi:short chain dehydrogenase [Popillia japonica]|uniref:Short chain dehydrogenase n=1 Tax=Popillia japonica TaxID=7064 RepID=A0AAW1IE07_POPJA
MGLYSEKSKTRLDGKTAVVTGSNTGIGKETAKDLYKRGATVILACRNSERAENAIKDIIDATKEVPNVGKLRLVELNLSSLKSIRECCSKLLPNVGKLRLVELNLSSLKSIRECCSKLLHNYDRIDLLINNAGIMSCPYGKTEDGFEIQFGTNHLGHFLLTLLLLPRIMKSTPARIVNVSSVAY